MEDVRQLREERDRDLAAQRDVRPEARRGWSRMETMRCCEGVRG